jgi:hypothetical protein
MGLLRYRIDLDNVQGLLADFLDNHEEFQLLDNNICSPTLHKEKVDNCCCNNISDNTNGNKLTIRQFTKRYVGITKTQFDTKQSINLAPFGRISPIKTN